jgi:transcriptional regulator with XRE-family HTH domain
MSAKSTSHSAPFAVRLRQAQADAEIGNEDLARKIGVGLRLVQRWRSGAGEPSGQNLVALAAALEREPGWFYETDKAAA